MERALSLLGKVVERHLVEYTQQLLTTTAKHNILMRAYKRAHHSDAVSAASTSYTLLSCNAKHPKTPLQQSFDLGHCRSKHSQGGLKRWSSIGNLPDPLQINTLGPEKTTVRASRVLRSAITPIRRASLSHQSNARQVRSKGFRRLSIEQSSELFTTITDSTTRGATDVGPKEAELLELLTKLSVRKVQEIKEFIRVGSEATEIAVSLLMLNADKSTEVASSVLKTRRFEQVQSFFAIPAHVVDVCRNFIPNVKKGRISHSNSYSDSVRQAAKQLAKVKRVREQASGLLLRVASTAISFFEAWHSSR